MPRESHRSMYDKDDRVHLPAHIVLLIAGVMLLFVGGGAVLVYSSINHIAPPQYTPSPQVQVTASATAHKSPTVHPSPTSNPSPIFQGSPTISNVPNPYPPHPGSLRLNDSLIDNSKGHGWDEGTFGNGGTCSFTGGSYHVGVSLQGHLLACNAEAVTFGDLAYEVQMSTLWSPDGRILASGSVDDKVQKWLAPNGSMFRPVACILRTFSTLLSSSGYRT